MAMAASDSTNGVPKSHDKANKKNKPFSWMSKKFASLRHSNSKGSSAKKPLPSRSLQNGASTPQLDGQGRAQLSKGKRTSQNDHYEDTSQDAQNASSVSLAALEGTSDTHQAGSSNSAAPTLATNPDTLHSDAGKSRAETANTTAGALSSFSGGGENSIFSSSNHSSRSLTTTLTTIQSTPAPGLNAPVTPTTAPVSPTHTSHPSQSSTYFTHQYPTAPASAVPPHLNPGFLPSTYRSATANNLLSDNASVLTLASSSQLNNRRRASVDTNASVRAIAPSSQWGGSRESLPLSLLSSQTADGIGPQQSRPSISGIASGERASVYSSSGVNAPALSSERNSVYAGRLGNREAADGSSLKGQEDARSTKSGMMGQHGRTDSIAGSISSPLATPKEPPTTAD